MASMADTADWYDGDRVNAFTASMSSHNVITTHSDDLRANITPRHPGWLWNIGKDTDLANSSYASIRSGRIAVRQIRTIRSIEQT